MQFKARATTVTNTAGTLLYGVEILGEGLQEPCQVSKSLEQYRQLEESLIEATFDMERHLHKGMGKDEAVIHDKIIQFMRFCLLREDVVTGRQFRQFCGLEEPQFGLLEERDRLQVGSQNMRIIDFCWAPPEMVLVTLQAQTSHLTKISNFVKTLFSQPSRTGVLKVWKQTQAWEKMHEITLEAEPLSMQWVQKSGFLLVATSIGISIYCFSPKQPENLQIMDFIKAYNVGDFCFGPKSAMLYYTTQEIAHAYSLSKEVTMELNSIPLPQIGGLGLENSEKRLYVCTGWGLRIFDVSEFKDVREVAKIEGICCFYRMVVSQKYLFGLSQTGFISVIEPRPHGKERLTDTLTNIDCPSASPFLIFHQKGQALILAHRKKIVFISTKNVALFSGGNHSSLITAGIYDPESNMLGCADEDGIIILYNLSMKI